VQELPRKDFYRLNEVCRYTGTQPYVLRFWESEFPQLQPSRDASGQRVYRRQDIDLVRRIKELLHDEDYTLDAARRQLANEVSRPRAFDRARSRRQPSAGGPLVARPVAPVQSPVGIEPSESAAEFDRVPRRRYEDAVDEVDRLRSALKEAEQSARRAEAEAEQARAVGRSEQARADCAVRHLERILEILS